MTCEDARLLLGAFHDGEISDLLLEAKVAEHVETCSACRRELDGLDLLTQTIRRHGKRFEVPASLRPKRSIAVHPSFLALAAALIFVLFLFWRPWVTSPLAMETLVQSHVRSLEPGHLIDVVSSDRHTVKPWFQGKIDFSPPVPNLAAQGFPLVGGRLDYIGHAPCAVLVYRVGKHVINVYVQRAGVAQFPSEFRDGGFSFRSWKESDLVFGALTDADPKSLSTFESEFIRATSP